MYDLHASRYTTTIIQNRYQPTTFLPSLEPSCHPHSPTQSNDLLAGISQRLSSSGIARISIQMDLIRLQLRLHLRHEHLKLLVRPTPKPRKQRNTIRLQRHLDKLYPKPPSNLFQALIPGPCSQWNHPLHETNILKPTRFEQTREFGRDIETKRLRELAELGEPSVGGAVFFQGVVVAPEVGAAFGQLDVPAWYEVGVDLGDQGRPVLDRAADGARVDEVEVRGGKGPGKGRIVDLELHVGGDPKYIERLG